MTFLSPWLAGIAAAIAVPSLIILYFLKLRRRDVEVSTTLLWRKAIQDLQANAPFQRLRRNILLLLQLLALAAVLLALGQPQVKGEVATGRRHVILIDRSASMQSLDGAEPGAARAKSRLDAAKEQAMELVRSLREPGLMGGAEGDEAMVIAFDTEATVRQTFTSDKNALRAAIESIEPSDGPGRLTEAFRLAKAHAPRRFVEGMPVEGLTDIGAAVVMQLWSDGRLGDARSAGVSPEDTLIYHRMGQTDAVNFGIIDIRAERAYDDAAKLTVFIGVQSTDRSQREVDVELLVNGRAAGLRSVRLSAAVPSPPPTDLPEGVRIGPIFKPATAGATFQLDLPEGALVEARLRQPNSSEPPAGDVLAVDDRAYLVVPPARRLSVALVTQGNYVLSAVLEGLPLSRLERFTPEEYDRRIRSTRAAEHDVVVLDGFVPPPETAGAAGLPPGRWLIFNGVPAGAAGLEDKGLVGPAQVIDWNRSHPVMSGLNLDDMFIAEHRGVEIAPGGVSTALASTERGPAIIEVLGVDSRAIVVPFDLASSSWPLHVSFVVFVASAMEYLGDQGTGAGAGRQLQPGNVLGDRLPGGVTSARITGPETGADLAPGPDGGIVYGPIQRTGVYTVRWSGAAGPFDERDGAETRRTYAANLTDALESDVPASELLVLASRDVSADEASGALRVRRLWPWLVLACLLVVMLEWYIYNRKVHV